MKKYEEKWGMHFVPECYFDTVLLKALLETNKRVFHKKGCNNVINELRFKSLKDDFAVAVIDKDKNEIDYLRECWILIGLSGFVLWKHQTKLHFIIQINPPVEKWVLQILGENGLRIVDFGYPANFKKLKKAIKHDIDNEKDEKLNTLVKAIIGTNSYQIVQLRRILKLLKDKNYHIDINELKNV
jgi:hypothetical protein